MFRVERARGLAWYAKYRLPDGRQVQKKLGPAWTGRGRPSAGYFTKRLAEDWLRGVLEQARRGTLPGLVRTGATFADAAELKVKETDRIATTVAGLTGCAKQLDGETPRYDSKLEPARIDETAAQSKVEPPLELSNACGGNRIEGGFTPARALRPSREQLQHL